MLYDKNGRPEFFSIVEVRNMLVGYDFFNSRRAEFLKEPELYVCPLLDNIHEMQRIPKELRMMLPEHFKLSDTDLSELENKCMTYIETADKL